MIDLDKLYVLIQHQLDNNLPYGKQAGNITDAILALYDLKLKPKPIEVGCKVCWAAQVDDEYNVIAIHDRFAWIDSPGYQTIAGIDTLKRID